MPGSEPSACKVGNLLCATGHKTLVPQLSSPGLQVREGGGVSANHLLLLAGPLPVQGGHAIEQGASFGAAFWWVRLLGQHLPGCSHAPPPLFLWDLLQTVPRRHKVDWERGHHSWLQVKDT